MEEADLRRRRTLKAAIGTHLPEASACPKPIETSSPQKTAPGHVEKIHATTRGSRATENQREDAPCISQAFASILYSGARAVVFLAGLVWRLVYTLASAGAAVAVWIHQMLVQVRC